MQKEAHSIVFEQKVETENSRQIKSYFILEQISLFFFMLLNNESRNYNGFCKKFDDSILTFPYKRFNFGCNFSQIRDNCLKMVLKTYHNVLCNFSSGVK